MENTVSVLKENGKRVLIIDDVPFFSFDPHSCKYNRPLNKRSCEAVEDNYYYWKNKWVPQLEKIADKFADVGFINLSRKFCSEPVCSMAPDGVVYYRDRNHLNIEGSFYVGDLIGSHVR